MAAIMDHDYYDGFRTFSWLADLVGLPIDQVRYPDTATPETTSGTARGKVTTRLSGCRCPPSEIPGSRGGNSARYRSPEGSLRRAFPCCVCYSDKIRYRFICIIDIRVISVYVEKYFKKDLFLPSRERSLYYCIL